MAPKDPHFTEPESEPEDESESEYEYEEENNNPPPATAQMEALIQRVKSEKVPLRVHDVIIKGNSKTKDSVIELQIQALKTVTSVQELLQAAQIASIRLQKLDIFDSVNVTLDAGPPGTSNVIVEVVECKNPVTGDIGIFTKPEARSWSLDGSLKLKNILGYGDNWYTSLSYGWNQTTEVSTGVSLPRFMRLVNPVTARLSLLSQDWLKFTSYKEQTMGLSLGIISTRNHDLAYNLSWRTLTDPSQLASTSVRRQLGHNLLSHLKYTFKIDKRNSSVRPTNGFAFVSTSQLGGIFPDPRSVRYIRQEFDLRYALPLGFARAALNVGVAGGVILPWGNGFLNSRVSLSDRFFLGGNASPVCTLGGPTSLLGFKTRGLGPSEPRREVGSKGEDAGFVTSSERDFLGGDLAVTAFADLSFDLPLKVLRDCNIHGHAFACAGSLVKLTENSFRDISFHKYHESFEGLQGLGLLYPLHCSAWRSTIATY